ncbi:MAG: phosphodiester glycosidase family protein [Lachnospiraceae bacterium]|nr:phosphodiester glycosidase family protein [Lachnospiraceae bacterium]
MQLRKRTFLYIACLLAFTTYAALDTFAIRDVYMTEAATINEALFEEEAENSDAEAETIASDKAAEVPDADAETAPAETPAAALTTGAQTANGGTVIGTYQNENISITLSQYDVSGTAVYAADVTLSSAQYLKTAFADDAYGKNITDKTSAIAEDNDAILAINGDYYGAREAGYVIRNGVLYRETADDEEILCIYADGTMDVINASEASAQTLLNSGVWQAFSFGPALVEEGEIAVTTDEEVGRAKASNPRTAIGMVDPLHYVMVVSDGRTDESEGLSLYELSEFMKSLGVSTAYNLDGGGSSTMVFQGELINNPTSSGKSIKERKVSDIVYIG